MKQETNKTKRTDIYSIDPRNIEVAEGFNSRVKFEGIDELAEQIREQGVLNPITVQIIKHEDGTETYRLVDGERRYRAVMKLLNEGVDIPYVKAIVVPANLSKEELYVQQAMRNEGQKFNEYEWAVLANKLRTECGKSELEISKMLGKNNVLVCYWLQILEMPEKFQALVRDGQISGSNLRNMLQANKQNHEKAWEEIEQLKKKAEEKGEKKLSLKDLDFDSNTKVYKDTKALHKGLKILMVYINKYGDENHPLNVNLKEVIDKLDEGQMIDKIFENIKAVQEAA